MRGFLDTNIVIRYLTGDSPDLTARATSIIESTEELIVTEGVLAEIGYVLTTRYGVEREVAIDTLIDFVQRSNIRPYLLNKGVVIQALLLCRPSGEVSFTDALLWATARSSDSRAVYTFDQRFPGEGIEVHGL